MPSSPVTRKALLVLDQFDMDGGAAYAEPALDLQRYLYLARRWAWLFAIAPVVGAALAFLYSRTITPVYAAQATVLINEAPDNKGADYFSMMLSERLSVTYAQLMTTRSTLNKVEARLGLPPGSVMSVQASTIKNNAQFIQVKAQHTDPEMAAKIVNTLVEVFAEEVVATLHSGRFAASKATLQEQADKIEARIESTGAQIQGCWNESEKASLEMRMAQYMQIYSSLVMSLEQVRMAELRATSNVLMLEPAVMASRVRPRRVRMMGMAGFMALLGAVGAVFGLNALDTTVKDPEELARQLRLPIQGVIPKYKVKLDEPVAVSQPRSPVAESFRALRTHVKYSGVDRPVRRLMVTSAMPIDGKTTVATNLAIVLAQSGMRVCLVDADMRRSMIHKVFGLAAHSRVNGLSQLFVQEHPDVHGAMVATNVPGLCVLPAGPHPPNPSELLGSQKMPQIFELLLADHDLLVIDTPPVMSVTDAAAMAGVVDAVLVVFRPGTTKMIAMKQAVAQLLRVNARVIGLVANGGKGYAEYYYREHYAHYAYHAHEMGHGGRLWRRLLHLAGW